MSDVGAGSLVEMLDEREHLLGIALWMFGSESTADWIVQETYRRWYALGDDERAAIAVPRAWLTRVAGSICLDLLAAPAASATPPPTAAPPTPAPATTGPTTPAPATTGPPATTPPAGDPVHRLAADLTRHLAVSGPGMHAKHDQVARRFATACEKGDVAALREVLATDAIVVSDGGGKLRAPVRPTYGADAVARFVTTLLAGRPGAEVALGSVNGRTGLVLRRAGKAVAVVSVSVAEDRVTAAWIVLNPDKLRHWHHPAPSQERPYR